MPSIIGYANLAQSSKFNKAYISTPEYNRVRRLTGDLAEEPISPAADKIMLQVDSLLKVYNLKDTLEIITTAIIASSPDAKWQSDICKELHSRLQSSIDILKAPMKSY